MKTRIAYAGGTFDLFHVGHVEFLRACRNVCDALIVSLNTDAFAERYKRKPIMDLQERKSVVEACRYVDRVIVNSGDEDSSWPILTSGANMIVHGDDWTGGDYLDQLGISEEWLKKAGIEVAYVPYSPALSSTEVIRRCQRSPQL